VGAVELVRGLSMRITIQLKIGATLTAASATAKILVQKIVIERLK
jgi:hypothetical protein